MSKVVIIGGMAAGCKTATRLKRINPDMEISVIEKNPFLSYGTCGMPFYASGDVDGFMDPATSSWDMIRDEAFFKNVKDINAYTNTEAINIDNDKKIVLCKNLHNSKEFILDYDFLVIATGAKAVTTPFPMPKSENISNFHNPLDAKRFREKAQTGQIGSVTIIGSGYIGCELAEAMVSLWGLETHCIELSNRLVPRAIDKEISTLIEKVLMEKDIKLHLNTKVENIELDENDNPVVFLDSREKIVSDYVFTCVGIKPNTELAKSIGIKTGNLGGIVVNDKMLTNIENVYAAGDCVEIQNLITDKPSFFPLGSLANRQGRVIANNLNGDNDKFKGAIGTSSVKVFDFIIASAGINEATAKALDINYDCVWGSWYDRPDYMPDWKTLYGKLIYDKKTRRLLGLQLAGYGEVARYIDAFSIFATEHKQIDDLLNFEHAYTPTHSGPLNPLNFLGAMADAQEFNNLICINPHITNFEGIILDVREPDEIKIAKYDDEAITMSVADYRKRLNELDKTKPILVVCQRGPRSYEVANTLLNSGFKIIYYLGGGVQFANNVLDKKY